MMADELSRMPSGEKPAIDIKVTVRDSVFRNLFSDRKYALKLYQAIHPEDTDITEDDISNVTIDNVLTDQLYNDLGMVVRGVLLVLLEAQSTWSVNIIIRILLYLASTWNRTIEESGQNRYGSKKLSLPKPEFYVIYTGGQKPDEWLRLSSEFLGGDENFLEVKVKVLYGEGKNDIISQYVNFTTIYTEQVKKYGRTQQAILETIRICKDKNILRAYLYSREKEVIDIMMALFNQEKALEQYVVEREKITREEGREEGEMKKARETALRMKTQGFPDAVISELVGVGLATVQQWLSGTKNPVLQ